MMSTPYADDVSTSVADARWNLFNKDLSKDYVYRMQNERFEAFKEQDLDRGIFDITFEIEGKILHAHKFILAAVSEPLFVMVSDRWNAKDNKPIKIQHSSYDNFYQFLCFIYSGYCRLTSENVFEMADMAECYAIPCLTEFCDRFFSDMKKTVKTIEKLYEFADTYSSTKLLTSIKYFVRVNRIELYKAENFLLFKKPFVQFLSTIDRDPDEPFKSSNPDKESGFFESVYKWAEHEVQKQKPVDDENFNLQEAIKIVLEPILPHIKFSKMKLKFLKNFVLKKGFLLSSDGFLDFYLELQVPKCDFFGNLHAPEDEETAFKTVYKLAQKQALKKQMGAGESFSVIDSIRDDLAQVNRKARFYKMDKEFLMDFVVANQIITKKQAGHVDDALVKVKNNGKIISGVFKDIIGIRNALEKCFCNLTCNSNTKLRFTCFKFPIPSTPRTVSKKQGVDWYLCLEKDGILTFKHHTTIKGCDYLLAEMESDTDFQLTFNALTCLTASPRNVCDL